MTAALRDHGDTLGVPTLSTALGVGRATAYRWRRPPATRTAGVRRPSPRALTAEEPAQVLAHLHAERFVDQSPAQVFATLLDEDTYLCSPRTMYRILTAYHEVWERRAPCRHAPQAVPRLTATPPN